MLTLKDLEARLAMNEWPLRRLLDALQPLMRDTMHRKQGQAIRVDSSAIGLLERAKELMGKGTPRSRLVEVLQAEMQGGQQGQQPDAAKPRADAGNNEQTGVQNESELVNELRNQIQLLREDNSWLKDRLQEKEEQLQRVLPIQSEGRKLLSLTQRIQVLFNGHL